MSKWVVDIHGEIEGDYEIIKKYEEPKTDVLDKIRAEIEQLRADLMTSGGVYEHSAYGLDYAMQIIDKYKAESEE